MNILVAGVVKNYALKRLQEEAQKRNHKLEGCYADSLRIEAETQKFKIFVNDTPLDKYDLIYLHAIGPRRWDDWSAALLYLRDNQGVKIINQGYNSVSEYSNLHKSNLPFPKTRVVFNYLEAKKYVIEFSFPLILKQSNSARGEGVFKINSKEELKDRIHKNKLLTSSFAMREFIPNNGDIRVFVVNYQAKFAMKRTPSSGDFRSNISQGGTGEVFDLDNNPEIKLMAEKISQATKIPIAGVDIMIHKETNQPFVLEINHAPQFQGLEKYTKANVAGAIIDYFLSLN